MLNECNGCEYQCKLSHIDICTLGSPCPHQRSTPMTEQDYIQTCNTEQLAEWICSVHEKCYYCGAKRVSDREHCPFGDGKCRNNKHEIAMWLKQPHTTKEGTK